VLLLIYNKIKRATIGSSCP